MSKACRSLAGTRAARSTGGASTAAAAGGGSVQFDGRYDR
jgi:hypothetical protein